MAKRFTDTEKWKKQWFRELPPKMKSVWEYICNNCDHAGIWEIDFEAMSFKIGEIVTAEECEKHFASSRFVPIADNKYFLPGFIVFQYGETIRAKNKVHLSVLKLLEKHNITHLVRGPWSIDRSTKEQSVEPEQISGDPAKIRAISQAVLKRMEAR